MLARQIEEVKQHALLGDAAVEILHGQRALRPLEPGHGSLREARGRDRLRAGSQLPDVREVRLARAGRTDDERRPVGPSRPAVDEIDGRRVRAADEEVLRAERRTVREVEDELARRRAHSPAPSGRTAA